MNIVTPQRTLNDALTLPEVGFGTYQLNGHEGVETMVRAIRNGYRLLDSAFNYENEGAVGELLKIKRNLGTCLQGNAIHRHFEASFPVDDKSHRGANLVQWRMG
jgi:hypothetical protein